jgi:hypothetical protein
MKLRLLIAVALMCAISDAQVPVAPILQPHNTFVDQSGAPCAGCTLGTFIAGTTTPTPTYTDSTGGPQNTNPIILSVQGGANIWVNSAVSYKFVLKDTQGTIIWTVDNVESAAGTAGAIVSSPVGSQTITQPDGTNLNVNTSDGGKLLYNGSEVLTAVTGCSNANCVQTNPTGDQVVTQPDGTNLSISDLLTKNKPFKCVETYLSADTVHSGTDYGAAISAAVQDSDPLTPTEIKICAPGDHPVFTTATIDRPIALFAYGSRLIPQSTMGSTPVTVSATASNGSKTVTVGSAAGLVVGMEVGGIGIPPGAYITNIAGTTVTLSLAARLQFYGVATVGSPVIQGVSSMSGLATSQVLNGIGNWPFVSGTTTISAINPVNNTITVSTNAVNGSITPNTFVVSGPWTTSLRAVTAKPVIRFIRNNAALQNQYTQMVGASMHGVWIADTSAPGGRNLTGVQGVQISGYDGFNSYDLRVDDMAGSGEILGGNLTATGQLNEFWTGVRESAFYNDQIRNSGDAHTGQAALAILTPQEGPSGALNADEVNQINFVGGHWICSNGPAVSIGTFNPTHTGTNGPRSLFFGQNSQIEGCAFVAANVVAQSDTIFASQAGTISFADSTLNLTGQGKALIRADTLGGLFIIDSQINSQGIQNTYQVTVTSGSPVVTFVSGPPGVTGAFSTSQTWDGVGVTINSVAMRLSGINPVAPSGNTLTLASNWAGATGPATMTIGFGGVMVEASTATGPVYITNDQIAGLDPASLPFIGLVNSGVSPFQVLEVGSGFLPTGNNSTMEDTFNGHRLTVGPTQISSTPNPDTTKQGVITSWNANGMGEVDLISVRGGGTGGLCLFNAGIGAGLGTAITCFDQNGAMSIQGANTDNAGIIAISASNAGTYGFLDTSINHSCTIAPTFDVGSGNRYWVGITGTTLTANFSAPVTGNVSYVCMGRR